MVYFDIDGVLRDLCAAAGISPVEWNCKIDGLSFIEYFSKRTDLLESAPWTEYFVPTAFYNNYIAPIELLSTQPTNWIQHTTLWVVKCFETFNIDPKITFTSDKYSVLNEGDLLIEDNPNLPNYDQLLLIDRPYNRKIEKTHTRIYTPAQLIQEILRRHHGAEV